jgi:hypothetical protein
VGNLSQLMSERKRGTEHLITSEEAKERFVLTEGGLLYTSGQLDREERDSYMFTILLGRKGLPRGFRGQQAIQVKVKASYLEKERKKRSFIFSTTAYIISTIFK